MQQIKIRWIVAFYFCNKKTT